MQFSIQRLILLIIVCSIHVQHGIAQKKKVKLKKTEPQAEIKEIVKEPTPQKITIIHEILPAKEKQKAEEITPLYQTKETVIIIKGPKPAAKNHGKSIDTVIVFIKDTTPVKPVIAIQKPIADKAVKNEHAVKTPSFEMDTEGNCGCVDMIVKTTDTLEYQQYINYTVTFKNNCKETVYINSASFHFIPFNFFGNPVRELRKISFVKRFNLPPFVRLDPKETFEFKFADDPFFEFDLHRHEQYKFSFIHSNKTQKYKAAPSKTYLCSRYEDKMVFVK
jgi:hypothetical protein